MPLLVIVCQFLFCQLDVILLDEKIFTVKQESLAHVSDSAATAKALMGDLWQDGMLSLLGKVGKIAYFDEATMPVVWLQASCQVAFASQAFILISSGSLHKTVLGCGNSLDS